MTHNPLSPGFVKIYSVQNLVTHVQTAQVIPAGTPVAGIEPDFQRFDETTASMSTLIDEYIVLVKPLFGSDTSFTTAEFWSQPAPEDDPVWIFTHPIGVVGTGTAASQDLLQAVMTFRTMIGGLYKLYFMEISGDVPQNLRASYPFSAGPYATLAAYMISDDGWIWGRDNSPLAVPIFFTTKVNDALRKKRLLM